VPSNAGAFSSLLRPGETVLSPVSGASPRTVAPSGFGALSSFLGPGGSSPPTDPPGDTLHVDLEAYNNAVGLTGGGTFYTAVRLTAPRACTVAAVIFYRWNSPNNDYLFVWAGNTPTQPGAVIESVPFSGLDSGWNRIDLPAAVSLAGGADIWVGPRMNHAAGKYPLGVDDGPSVAQRGGWINFDGSWVELVDVGLDVNWHTRAVLGHSGAPPQGDTLHVDLEAYNNAVGLTGGGIFYTAARLTPAAACTVKTVIFYKWDASNNDYLFVWGAGTPTNPGALIESVPYSGSTTMAWQSIDLPVKVPLAANQDIWVGPRMNHGAGDYPLGVDDGPAVAGRGGWLNYQGSWEELSGIGLDVNWHIRAIVGAGGGGGGTYEHVTITSGALAGSFGPLKQFLLDYAGLHDTVVTTEAIYAGQTGRDNPEKIRNFIKYAYQNWQTTFVLLGGDVEVVPHRLAYPGHVSGNPPWNDTIPCDLYYSDLDGTWDANGNNIFGEMGDGADLAPEVYVGRAPVSDATEASRFVTKTVIHGHGGSAHRQKVLLAGFDYDADSHGEVTMDYYDNTYINSPFTCTKVYDSYFGNHADSVRNCLNQGYHYFIHGDHGNVNELCTGATNHGWSLNGGDLGGLNNGFDKLSVFMASACLVGAFDVSDCVMEAFLNAPNGGAVAAMPNSRYGWYMSGENPQVSYSHAFVEKYVTRIFSHGTNPAETKDFLLGKTDIIGQATADTFYRWCMYDYNLFGEPALKLVNLTGIEDAPAGARRARILTARPAVFSRFSTVEFELGRRGDVRLEVYDASGRRVRTLVEGTLAPGRHSVRWDGRSSQGAEAPAGVYVVDLKTDGGSETRKVVRCAGKEQ